MGVINNWFNKKKSYWTCYDYYKTSKNAIVEVLKQYKAQNYKIAIWGSGIKGTSFLNIVDPNCIYIDEAIDINEKKVGQTIAKRKIVSCNSIKGKNYDVILFVSQKHIVQNLSILKKQGVTVIAHDLDEIVKRKLSAEDIMSGKDMQSNEEENIQDTQLIQKELLPILIEVRRVCEENDIPYFLCAGSVLGAVRHGGYIPWDDDIDVGMLRKDYIKFLEVAPSKLKEDFILVDSLDVPNYYVGHAKVFKNHTANVNFETSHLQIHHGFYLDIFPFDTIPEDVDKQNEMYKKVMDIKQEFYIARRPNMYSGKNIIIKRLTNSNYYKTRNNANKIFEEMNHILTKYLDSDSTMVADLFAPYYKKLFYHVSDIYPAKFVDFEGAGKFPIPGNYDKYLKVMYGDYMTLPPKEKRYVKHNIIYFSTENNYPEDAKLMRKKGWD